MMVCLLLIFLQGYRSQTSALYLQGNDRQSSALYLQGNEKQNSASHLQGNDGKSSASQLQKSDSDEDVSAMAGIKSDQAVSSEANQAKNKADAQGEKIIHTAQARRSYEASVKIVDFVEKYENKMQKKGAQSPYTSCRIVVKNDSLTEDYEAMDSLHCTEFEEYILQYETESQTKKAYEKLRKKYGSDCYLDEIITEEALLEEDSYGAEVSVDSEDASETSSTVDSSIMTWGYQYMGFDYAKSQTPSDRSSIVAIIDSGCDMDNWYFTSSNTNRTNDVIFHPDSYDFVENDSSPQDETSIGHGTHVAGILSSCVSDKTSIMILRVFNSSGNTSKLLVDTALKYAIAHDVDVINMSLGKKISSGTVEDCWDDSILEAYEKNILICCASGNTATSGDNLENYYPACHEKTIAVGAIDSNASCASFSCQGENLDFCAPGVGIVSALNGGSQGETKTNKGTSMAAPHVTAVISYLKMAWPDADAATIYAKAVSMAQDLGVQGKDAIYGYGYLRFTEENYQVVEEDTDTESATTESGQSETTEVDQSDTTESGQSETETTTEAGTSASKTDTSTVTTTTASKTDTSKASTTTANKTSTSKTSTTTASKTSTSTTTTVSKVVTVKVLPPTKIKVKKSSSRSRTLTWKKVGRCSGYQIQYSTDKKFKKAVKRKTISSSKVTKKKISSLKKGKKYYFRIRSYYKTKKKIYYSKWSKIYKK